MLEVRRRLSMVRKRQARSWPMSSTRIISIIQLDKADYSRWESGEIWEYFWNVDRLSLVDGGVWDTITSINARQGEVWKWRGRGSYKGDSRVDMVIGDRMLVNLRKVRTLDKMLKKAIWSVMLGLAKKVGVASVVVDMLVAQKVIMPGTGSMWRMLSGNLMLSGGN
jgi:hypothetical protein